MSNSYILNSPNKNLSVKIDAGELVSYIFNNEELIHQKEAPGWRNSDTEMFPIIGPTAAKNFKVNTPKGDYNQDQHGLLRELKYVLESNTEDSCTFRKKYAAYTAIENSKYPKKSPVRLLSWPYNFTFRKKFKLTNKTLHISFEIDADGGMPFMLGYHPAFKLAGNKAEIINTNTENITIQKILDQGSTALPVLNTSEILLKRENGLNLSIKTEGFNNFMLWTEVPNMVCIEPITAYPYLPGKMLAPKLFKTANGIAKFKVSIGLV